MATASRTTIPDRIAYLNLACRFQRLCAVSTISPPFSLRRHPLTVLPKPTALIGMVTWAVGYRFRHKASSQAYWIIWLVVWISETVMCIMK